jgi:hypothetical protein
MGRISLIPMKHAFKWPWLGLLAVALGCSNSPSRLVAPTIDSGAGEAAIKQYDTNGDGGISAAELDKTPPLKSALSRLDKNHDGKLTADEINGRIEQWKETRVALTSVAPTVRLDGKLLTDAQVTLLPEQFLGDAVEQATGKTNDRGIARPRISDQPEGIGVRLGFYRIQISKTVNGKELVPARYNTQTELGIEIASDIFETRNPELNLVSR